MGEPSGPVPEETGQKPLRADARRNRARILEAADEVFAASGPSASTEEVARRADVAIGTLFRHFPTKDALVEAVFVNRLQSLADQASALAAADDPAEAFFGFLTSWIDLSADKLTFADALARQGVDVSAAAGHASYVQVRADLLDAVGRLLTRAQAAAAVRDDIGVAELNAVLVGAARMAEHGRHEPTVLARARDVVFDGLRPR